MFAMALHVEPNSVEAMFLSTVVQLDELFAHLLFWCVVIAALDALDVPSYRVVGFACAVYAGVSIVWVVLMSRATVVDTTLVLLAAYAVVVFAMRANWNRGSLAQGASASSSQEVVSDSLGVAASVEQVVADEPDEEEPDATGRLHALIAQRCEELADAYGLSPRERDVFACMARGRTRAGIQEDLVLSGNTVKTHVAHIYAKLGVHDRQEMMALLLGQEEGAVSRGE